MSEITKESKSVTPKALSESESQIESKPELEQKEEQELPEFNLKNVLNDIKFGITSLFINSNFSKPVSLLILLAESISLKIIIAKISYTEIDYSTYMQQISLIESGELDYSKITGDTGPIVYPGGYVFIYSWMKWITKSMEKLENGQFIFRWLYILTLLITLIVYFWGDEHPIKSRGGNVKKITPIFLYLLMISKRLHSIYVLRLFNDCFTTLFGLLTILSLLISVYFKQQKDGFISTIMVYLASDLLSVAISIKMNALLYLPGFLIIIYFINDENLLKCLGNIIFGLIIQIGINWQFLDSNETIRYNFLLNAFNFKREFLYEWTVNWKFLSEEIFLNSKFHKLLLGLHLITISLFIFNKWINSKITGKPISILFKDGLKFWSNTISKNNIIFNEQYAYKFVVLIMFLSNLIGILFARSLHYQFLSWYHFSIPYLLFHSGISSWIAILIMIGHEWCWNVYPSNKISSGILIGMLSIIVICSYLVDPFEKIDTDTEAEKKKHVE